MPSTSSSFYDLKKNVILVAEHVIKEFIHV
jgi:hypothetical protein